MDSILLTVKKLLGGGVGDTSFDTDLIIHINSVFMILTQMGVGPSGGFSITDQYAVWSDFIPEGSQIEAVRTYMYLKVKLIFDPPTSSSAIEAIKETIKELEWRLNASVDPQRETGEEA